MDPYHPPETEIENGSRQIICRQIVIWWEKRRLVYNGLMLLVGMVFIAFSSSTVGLGELISSAVAFGLGANVCYFAGPLVELYYSAIALKRSNILAELMFWAGLIFSLLLVVGIGLVLTVEFIPDQM